MTKKEYDELLETEVFTSKSNNILRRLFYHFKDLYLNPSHHAIYIIRKMQYVSSKNNRLSFYRALWLQKQLVQKYSMHVSPFCKIGKGFHLPHPVGIVIGSSVVIGENCSVYQNVTLGGARTGDVKKKMQPEIGANCTIFAGAMVLGGVKIQDNCIVAANSVLLSSTMSSGVYAGSPAKKVK